MRILQFLLWLILLTWIGRKLLGWLARIVMPDSMPRPSADAASGVASRQLERDPQCGTFVSPQVAVTAECDGKVIHFCSAACRDAYLQPRAARSA